MSSPGNTAIELGGVLATAQNVVFGGKFAPSAQLFKNSVCTPIKNLPFHSTFSMGVRQLPVANKDGTMSQTSF